MAYKIVVDIVDPGDGLIKVTHTFWGQNEREARTNFTHYLASCDYFAAAAEEGYVIEEEFEIDESEIPEAEDVASEGDDLCGICGKPLDECDC